MSLREAFKNKILLLDGGMGSLIQEYGIKGANNDQLSIDRPDVILDIHRRYVQAGVDVLTTNTFSSQRISQHEYHQEDKIAELNRASVRLARQAADEVRDRQIYVVGDVGPTSKMLSMSDDVNDPAARAITFDELESAYYEQIKVLVEEGVDGILIETIFDTLNAKAALSAYDKVKRETLEERSNLSTMRGPLPDVLLSMTVSDASGRTLSGQTVEAFVTSVLHARPLCLGLNCGLGADGMVPYLRQMSAAAPCFVSCHPNAGLPNQFGGYDDTPEDMVRQMQSYFDEKLVNMVGGCCGTTPAHIAAMRAEIDRRSADSLRQPAPKASTLTLSGLECMTAPKFVKVGERCNVAGSRKFLRLISEKNYDEALEIARKQVEDGAMVIDVNMDDGLLDAKEEMVTFLNLLASDPAISRVPIMVDSSRWDVIEAGLKCIQGKGVVNSISLKMGEEEFLSHARVIRRLGAAVIAMCFDEEGQATDYERRVKICQRMYDLLVDRAGFDPQDIIFDPNVLTIATGMSEHFAYAQDFIRATRWVKDHLPGTRVSGGLSNLSFAFRGNNYLRESMHSVFLHHAISNGMGMAIMNPATEVDYKTIPLELRMAITEVVLNTYDEASEELIEIAQRMSEAQAAAKEAGVKYDPKAIFKDPSGSPAGESLVAPNDLANASTHQSLPLGGVGGGCEQRLQQALLKGVSTTLEADLMELIHRGDSPLNIISGPLMDGMNEVGRLFGEGKMFLPQVVKTARTMKKAVEILNPFMDAQKADANHSLPPVGGKGQGMGAKIVIATVKGDVHDIGKNIVSVIMSCNNFQVVDLGVMVPTETIVQAAIEQKADIVSLSGLITPSLEEMCNVAKAMQEAGLRIPIMVGGATTSPIHTAVKIAPCYEGPVFHVRDAAMNPGLAMKLLDPAQREAVIVENRQEQERIRQQQIEKQSQQKAEKKQQEAAGAATPLQRRWTCDWSQYQPAPAPFFGKQILPTIALNDVAPLIDWTYFYWTWRVKADSEEGQKLKADADALLRELINDSAYGLSATQAFYPASGKEDRISIQLKHSDHDPACPCCNKNLEILTPRQQKAEGTCLALCDYLAQADASQSPVDTIGAFAVTINPALLSRLEALKNERGGSDYDVLMLQTLADRLAEAGAEYLSQQLAEQHQWRGIRPAIGYPSLPDQKNIFLLAEMIDFDKVGISLTENGAMYPQASVCGLYISNPAAEYFSL